MRKITFETEKEIETVVKSSLNVSEISYVFTDYGDSVVATIYLGSERGNPRIEVLWEGDSYTAIGQYTDEDVDKRIFEILNINQ